MYCHPLLIFESWFKFQISVCNDCHDLIILCLNIRDIGIISVKGVDYRCVIHDISKPEAIHLLENSVKILKILQDHFIHKMHVKEIYIKNRVYYYSCQTYGSVQ